LRFSSGSFQFLDQELIPGTPPVVQWNRPFSSTDALLVFNAVLVLVLVG